MRSGTRAWGAPVSLAAFVVSLAALAGSLGAASCAAAQAQATRQQLVVPLAGSGFVGFRLETAFDGGDRPSGYADVQAALLPQALLDDGNTIHRVLLDRDGVVVFAYDLVVEPLAAARRFRLTALPVGAEFERQLRARRGGAAAQSAAFPTLPRAAEAQTLEDGDALALDLLVNARAGVRVVDVVKVAFGRARLWQSSPRDFTLDSVQIALSDPRLVVDGEVLPGAGSSRGVAGALVWFHAPGRGRFILSLVPRPGYDFQKIALIDENKISFDFRGEHYEWVSSAPVVGSGGSWFAWVLHDKAYEPEVTTAEEIRREAAASGVGGEKRPGTLERVLEGKTPRPEPRAGFDGEKERAGQARERRRVRIGAADRMENLLPKK